MPGRALVAYGTKYGSTAEIAEAIGATLAEAGLAADVWLFSSGPVGEAQAVAGSRAAE